MTSGSTARRSIDANWRLITVKNRVESSQKDELMTEISAARDGGIKAIVLDFRGNRFISLQAIQALVTLAEEMASAGQQLAFLGCFERTKKHFEIYGSLKKIRVLRSESELPPKSSSQPEI